MLSLAFGDLSCVSAKSQAKNKIIILLTYHINNSLCSYETTTIYQTSTQ